MKRILLALFLLGPPLQAQHRSAPGTPFGASIAITTNGQCQVVSAGGTNSAMFAVTGTWTGTLGFFGTNDLGVTTVALQAYPVNTTTGALGSSSVNTTTGNGVWIADTFGMYQAEICATAAMTGSALIRIDADPATAVMQVTGVGGAAIQVAGSFSSTGAADVVSTGAPTTFNANTICTGALLTAGLQSAGFHLDAGTLAATLTAQCSAFTSGTTNFTTGGLKDVTGAAVTGIVTNPNAQTDWTITCPGDTRRVQVCTTAFTSGSTTGQAVGTFYQTASAAGGGGGGPATQSTAGTNAQAWWMRIGDATNGPVAVKAASTAAVASDSALVCAISPNNTIAATQSGTWSLAANQSVNEAQINGVAPSMGNGVSGTGVQRMTLASDSTGQVAIAGTVNDQGLGAANAPSGGVMSVINPTGNTAPFPVKTFGTDNVAANAADNSATAATLNSACTSTTSCTVAQSIQWAMNGNQGATLTITTQSSPVGTALTCDPSYDGGTTYALAGCDLWQNHGAYRKGALTNTDATATAPQQWIVYAPNSPSHIRIRLATFTSGSVTVAGRATMSANLPFPFWAKPQVTGTVTLTASTAETTLLAGAAGTFNDLTDLACHTTVATANTITVRDSTGGTTRKTIICPAAIGPCEGWAFTAPLQQATVNTNWTVQAGTSASSVICDTAAVQR